MHLLPLSWNNSYPFVEKLLSLLNSLLSLLSWLFLNLIYTNNTLFSTSHSFNKMLDNSPRAILRKKRHENVMSSLKIWNKLIAQCQIVPNDYTLSTLVPLSSTQAAAILPPAQPTLAAQNNSINEKPIYSGLSIPAIAAISSTASVAFVLMVVLVSFCMYRSRKRKQKARITTSE